MSPEVVSLGRGGLQSTTMRSPEQPPEGWESFTRVYPELRALARLHLASERRDHTLQATALVHEAYLRLVECGEVSPDDPAAFYRSAALAMRRILLDYARKKGRIRHGRGLARQSLDAVQLAATGNVDDIVAVDEAISLLQERDAELGELVRLRFYAGLSIEETARALGRSVRTVHREWAYAKACLYQSLSPDG